MRTLLGLRKPGETVHCFSGVLRPCEDSHREKDDIRILDHDSDCGDHMDSDDDHSDHDDHSDRDQSSPKGPHGVLSDSTGSSSRAT